MLFRSILGDEAYNISVIIVLQIFTDYCSRNSAFAPFSSIGSVLAETQDNLLKVICDAMEENMGQVYTLAKSCHDENDVHPYIMRNAKPNVFSFLHLTYQSLVHDYVLSFYSFVYLN